MFTCHQKEIEESAGRPIHLHASRQGDMCRDIARTDEVVGSGGTPCTGGRSRLRAS
jgi:hypothetical protein